MVRRRSGARPLLPATVRRVRRRGGVSRIRAMILRSAASSSGVQAANDLCRRVSTSEAIRPSTASSSRPSWAGSVAGTSSTAWVSGPAWAVIVSSSRAGLAASRKKARNTSS